MSEEDTNQLQFYKFYHRNVQDCLGPGDYDINRAIEDQYVQQFGQNALPSAMLLARMEREDLREVVRLAKLEGAR